MADTSRKVVIIGGGVIGLGIGYHLAELGESDVLLVERHLLTSGTSWHAAGIVGPLRASMNMTRLASYASELFPVLETKTGQSSGYIKTGGYWLAQSEQRMCELQRVAAMGELTGIASRIIGAEEFGSMEPYVYTNDLKGVLRVEDDAQANPVDLCMAYAKRMRMAGIDIQEGVSCVGIRSQNGRVHGVVLSDGSTIRCKAVVNCAGAWAKTIGDLAGVPIPLQAVEHMYVVTEAVPALPTPLPILRDLDSGIYIKGDAGKVLLGGFEYGAKVWNEDSIVGNQPFLELPEDWDHFMPFMSAGLRRVPVLEDVGVRHFMNGPETFTPDSKQLLGESPFLRGFFVAAGMNSVGMMSSAGIGKAMAEWITSGEAPFDLWEVDIARFGREDSNVKHLAARMNESVGDVFATHPPLKQAQAGRNLKRTVLHEDLERCGAVFGSFSGWERPLWFAQSNEEYDVNASYGNQHWWQFGDRECERLVNHAILFDLSPFTKLDVVGDNALFYMQRLCANDVDVSVDKTIYTQCLNHRGGIEADVTVTRVSSTRFRLTSGAATRWRDVAWLKRIRDEERFDVDIADVTEAEAVIGIMGPHSCGILESLLTGDTNLLSNQRFPVGTSRQIKLGDLDVRATRLSFVGELGYELSVPVSNAQTLLQLLKPADDIDNAALAGHLILDSCRLEKAYRHWGHEIGPDDSPLEAGLGFAVAWKKDHTYIGKEALIRQKQNGLSKRLILFRLAGSACSHPLVLHDEPVYKNGVLIGRTTSGGKGFRTNSTLCFAYVKCNPDESLAAVMKGQFEISVEGERFAIIPLSKAPYDAGNERMKN